MIEIFEIKKFTCNKCNFIWFTKRKDFKNKNSIPVVCYKCRSKYWNGEKIYTDQQKEFKHLLLLSEKEKETIKRENQRGKR